MLAVEEIPLVGHVEILAAEIKAIGIGAGGIEGQAVPEQDQLPLRQGQGVGPDLADAAGACAVEIDPGKPAELLHVEEIAPIGGVDIPVAQIEAVREGARLDLGPAVFQERQLPVRQRQHRGGYGADAGAAGAVVPDSLHRTLSGCADQIPILGRVKVAPPQIKPLGIIAGNDLRPPVFQEDQGAVVEG